MKLNRTHILIVLVAIVSGGIGAWLAVDVLPHAFFSSRSTIPSNTPATIVNLMEEETATIHVVEQVTPAVVSVVARKPRGEVFKDQAQNSDVIFSDTTLTDAQAKELVDVSSGTGFFVSADGFVVTNRHVIDVPNAQLFVVTNDGKELSAKLIDTDPVLDLAILRVDGTGFPIVTLGDSDKIQIGQTAIAIGNTLSEFRNTVTKGVISGINRHVTAGVSVNASEVIEKAIQTDAAINPGNSGGPLINLLGEVIGINTAVSFDGQSVAFAIPINQVKRAIQDVETTGKIARPWLGIHYVLTEPSQTKTSSPVTFTLAALITKDPSTNDPAVIKDGPADKAGLKEGDLILSIDGTMFTQGNAIAELLSAHRPGDQVKMVYVRDGKTTETTVTLGDVEKK